MITGFDIATDLKVEIFAPDELGNIFIIGVSTLGGGDVLAGAGQFIIGESLLGGTDTLVGASAFDWQPIECFTTQAGLSVGGSIQNALYFQPEASTLSLTVQSWAFDPNNSSAVRPNMPIRIRLDNGVVNQVLFTGLLDTFSVTYAADTNSPNTITFNATDIYKRIVNTRIADFDTTGLPAGYATPNEVIEIVAANAGVTVSAASETLDGKLPTEQVFNSTGAQFINDAIQVGLGVLWVDPETEELVVINRPTVVSTAPVGTWTIGNNHGEAYHLCMSGITVSGDSDTIFNSLYCELASDPAVNVVVEDADSIELYGYSSQTATVNTTDATELERWANAVSRQRPTKLVKTITTPTIDRLGNLTAAAGFKPGELIRVKYSTDNIEIDDLYTVIKVSHSVDVNVWNTTLELWKEF